MEETFFKEDNLGGVDLLVSKSPLGWKWDEKKGLLVPLLVWDKKRFVATGRSFRFGQWDQWERVDFLQRLCRLFYHDINGKITGFDGMIQLWKFRFPDKEAFSEDLNLLEQSVVHLKKLNLLMDAGTDLRKVSEFHLASAVSLLDGLTQRVLGIIQPIQVSEINMVKGAVGYTLFLIWSFISQVASLSTTRSNWKLNIGSGLRWKRDLVITIQSEGLPSILDVLEGIPQHSRFNRWILMRLACDDILDSQEGNWSFAFDMKMDDSNISQFSVGSDGWMKEIFKSSLFENKPLIPEEKKTNVMIKKVLEILF